MPATFNVTLSRELKEFVLREVARGGHGSAGEYIEELLRGEVARRSREVLERDLLDGLASPASAMGAGDWKSLRAGVPRVRRQR